jgi:SAM-dependent methyltransferase
LSRSTLRLSLASNRFFSKDLPGLAALQISNSLQSWINEKYNHNEYLAQHSFLVFRRTLEDLEKTRFQGLEGKRVLDLGCGTRYYFALLSAAHGAEATALDVIYTEPAPLPLFFYRKIRHDGLKLALRSLIRIAFLDRPYYQKLQELSSRPVLSSRSQLSFVATDPTDPYPYPLPSESFDLIVSQAVLEHIENVDGFASEVHRLLKRNGYFFGMIHNYYSISGGHRPEWSRPDSFPSCSVPPWDHLREHHYPSTQYLNRLFPEEYQSAFANYLEIVVFDGRGLDYSARAFEGEAFLTSGIRDELSQYPRELLLTRAWCMICKKTVSGF